jgi:hypothetical protein
MSHCGILTGLVQQLASGSDDAAAAAALLLARYSAGSGSAAIAAQLTKSPAALRSIAALLQQKRDSISLADAAAQLLHTAAEAGPEAAQAVAETEQAVASMLSLLLTHSKVPQQPTQQSDAIATAAGWRAACALCSILYSADASVAWRVAKEEGVVAALAPALQRTDSEALQDRAVHVLWAAANQDKGDVCSLIISQIGLAQGLLHMLPGGARPMKAAEGLAVALATNSSRKDFKQLMASLITGIAGTVPACSAATVQCSDAAAALAAWVLTQLPSVASTEGHQQLSDAMAALLPVAGSDSKPPGMLRVSLASKLGAVLSDNFNGPPEVQSATATALSVLVQSVSTEERTKMASSAYVMRGLGRHLDWFHQHGCKDSDSAASIKMGADAASAAVLQLAANSKLQLAAHAAPVSMQACSATSVQSWLAASMAALQQMVACNWGSLTVAQLAAIATVAGKAQIPQELPAVKCNEDWQHNKPRIEQHQHQQKTAPNSAPPPAPPTPPPPCQPSVREHHPHSAAAALLAAAGALKRTQLKADATSRKTPLPARPDCLKADRPGPVGVSSSAVTLPAVRAGLGEGVRLPAGQAASSSKAPDRNSAAFYALDSATQKLIQEACGSIPPDEQLPAWQVAVQPFDSQQLQDPVHYLHAV